MTQLKNYLTSINLFTLLKVVEMDIHIMKNKKYLIHGTTPELALYWTDLFGEVGKTILVEDFYNNPLKYFKTFIRLFKEHIVGVSQFPLVLSKINDLSPFFNNQFQINTLFLP
tara:strand:+ start:950 stop:1288 length:339 start_codon:yes stop_codon:yes gene_type:complete